MVEGVQQGPVLVETFFMVAEDYLPPTRALVMESIQKKFHRWVALNQNRANALVQGECGDAEGENFALGV